MENIIEYNGRNIQSKSRSCLFIILFNIQQGQRVYVFTSEPEKYKRDFLEITKTEIELELQRDKTYWIKLK